MISNLAISVFLMASACGQNPAPKQYEVRRKETIYAVAHVNGRAKDVDSVRYLLVATYESVGPLLAIGDNFGSVWVINGQPARMGALSVQPKSVFKDELPLGMSLWWLKIPHKGNLELLYGTISYSDLKEIGGPNPMRKLLLKNRYVPYAVAVDKLPKVQAKSAAELAKKMKELSKSKDRASDKKEKRGQGKRSDR